MQENGMLFNTGAYYPVNRNIAFNASDLHYLCSGCQHNMSDLPPFVSSSKITKMAQKVNGIKVDVHSCPVNKKNGKVQWTAGIKTYLWF